MITQPRIASIDKANAVTAQHASRPSNTDSKGTSDPDSAQPAIAPNTTTGPSAAGATNQQVPGASESSARGGGTTGTGARRAIDRDHQASASSLALRTANLARDFQPAVSGLMTVDTRLANLERTFTRHIEETNCFWEERIRAARDKIIVVPNPFADLD